MVQNLICHKFNDLFLKKKKMLFIYFLKIWYMFLVAFHIIL